MTLIWSPNQCRCSILHFYHQQNFNLIKKKHKHKTRGRKLEMWDVMCHNQRSTNLRLHININLSTIQQSIDHIQMSFLWSQNQCGLSILHFFNINQILIKKTHPKTIKKKIRDGRCGCRLAQSIFRWPCSAHGHQFVCNPAVGWPHPNVHSLKP